MSTLLELLAPARNADIAIEALLYGADAVYMGGPAFGARSAAGNSVEDIRKVVEIAHAFHARVFITVNTIIYPGEIEEVRRLVHELYDAGVDALIVQDMAFAEMRSELPPIALHASTQCDIRTPEKAAALAAAGFEQLVLPREFSLEETRKVRAAVPPEVELEAFVHGALCVSYSGDCQAGFMATGRSANRGECPQMCRLPYVLTDAAGHTLAPEAHYLSLRDLHRIESLEEMADAGVTSFKIEGRLKDADYVRNVVAAYSQALDRLCNNSSGRYARRSHGRSICGFTPDLDRTFNRGYTPYFLHGRPSKPLKMASLASPKWAGRPVGRIISGPDPARGGRIEVESSDRLENGDGLTFVHPDGHIEGFRLNRAEGRFIYPAGSAPRGIRPGMTLYRNTDKAFNDSMEKSRTRRYIPVDMLLETIPEKGVRLHIFGPEGFHVTESQEIELQQARTPQEDTRRRTLSKLGDTEFELNALDDRLGNLFIPSSVLADLRRKAVDSLRKIYQDSLPRPARKIPSADIKFAPKLDYHDNVANPLAKKWYENHGSRVVEEAVELKKPEGEVRVMTTRYCLRRELGICLKDNDGTKKKYSNEKLYLRSTAGTPVSYRLDFDCGACRMYVVSEQK